MHLFLIDQDWIALVQNIEHLIKLLWVLPQNTEHHFSLESTGIRSDPTDQAIDIVYSFSILEY